MQLALRPLKVHDAEDIVRWQYPGQYAVYDVPYGREHEAIGAFTNKANAYHAVDDALGNLVAFCCFGADAQVPGGDYSAPGLDLGLGIKPDLTGRGLGSTVVASVIAFGVETYHPEVLRVSIASWNERALKVWSRASFHVVQRFVRSVGAPVEFVVMTRRLGRGCASWPEPVNGHAH